MIKIDIYKGGDEDIFIREMQDNPAVTSAVAEILANVKAHGDEAVRDYPKKLDGCDL